MSEPTRHYAAMSQQKVAYPLCLFVTEVTLGVTTPRKAEVTCATCKRMLT